jgi:hypothetical protein
VLTQALPLCDVHASTELSASDALSRECSVNAASKAPLTATGLSHLWGCIMCRILLLHW